MQWHLFWDSLQGFLVIFSLGKRWGSQILPRFFQNPLCMCVCSSGYHHAGPTLLPCSHRGYSDIKWMHKNPMCLHATCEGRNKLSVWTVMIAAFFNQHFLHCSHPVFSVLFLPTPLLIPGSILGSMWDYRLFALVSIIHVQPLSAFQKVFLFIVELTGRHQHLGL